MYFCSAKPAVGTSAMAIGCTDCRGGIVSMRG